jgi:hypothetical protein
MFDSNLVQNDFFYQNAVPTVPALRPCSGGDGRGRKKEGTQPEITIEYIISLHNWLRLRSTAAASADVRWWGSVRHFSWLPRTRRSPPRLHTTWSVDLIAIGYTSHDRDRHRPLPLCIVRLSWARQSAAGAATVISQQSFIQSSWSSHTAARGYSYLN